MFISFQVALQKGDIERISNTVVGATENVREANEQIKQAIQRNAGLRVYVLFFLLVMSFSLLFLDWYNDWVNLLCYAFITVFYGNKKILFL